MNNPRLSKSGIEYLDYQWGIFSGCGNLDAEICPVKACWAKSLTERFPNHYPAGFFPEFYHEALKSPLHLKKPNRIGVGWVGDVIGYGLLYKNLIFDTIKGCPQHTFLFLTKNPDRLISWGEFPDNCWVGVTATTSSSFWESLPDLRNIKASVKYLSLEPLLENITGLNIHEDLRYHGIDWVIIGAHTKPYKPPEIEWILEILEACDKAGIPVFLKNNLLPAMREYYKGTDIWGKLRQELP